MTIPDYTFTLSLPSTFDSSTYGEFATAAIGYLGSVEVNVYSYGFDGGDLGQLELDLEDVEVDLSDALGDFDINNAIEMAERYTDLSSEPVEQKITLTQVREAFCEAHGCTPYEYLARIAEEITDTAMVLARTSVMTEYENQARQESERVTAASEADKLVVEQSIQDRNKAQELYGKQAEQMREAVKLLRAARSQMHHEGGPFSMSEDEQQQDHTAKQIEEFLTKLMLVGTGVTETETETETTTDSTDAEA